MRNNREYEVCKAIAQYMRLQYPKVLFHWDLAGLNLSRAQAGMMKSIQGGRGWPDFFIPKVKRYSSEHISIIDYNGCFIEVKAETPFKKDGTIKSDKHLQEQDETLKYLRSEGYLAVFGIGFDHCKKIIDEYLN